MSFYIWLLFGVFTLVCVSLPSMSSAQKSCETSGAAAPPKMMPGGIAGLREVDGEDLKIWEMYKAPLEKQIQDQFKVPTSFKLKPTHVATQVVAGQNYFFKVEVPDKKYATARVYHVPWKADTHGQADHVSVHAKLADNPNENVGHF